MDPAQLAHAVGVATGRREVAERLAAELRRSVATWRASEAKAGGLVGTLRQAFLWSLTERWCSRLEVLAAQVEAQLAELRNAELGARMAYEQASRAAATPLPSPPKKKSARGRR